MDLKGENVKFSLCYEKKKSILSITASDLISFECMNYEFSKKKKTRFHIHPLFSPINLHYNLNIQPLCNYNGIFKKIAELSKQQSVRTI